MHKPIDSHDYIHTLRKCLLPKNSKVMIFGDAIVDRFIRVKSVKKSPESPVLALETDVTCEDDWDGGAKNIEHIMRELGLKVESYIDESVPRSKKIRYMYNGQCVTRVDYDVIVSKDYTHQTQKYIDKMLNSVKRTYNVVIQDYGKGAINDTFYDILRLLDKKFVIYGPHISTTPSRKISPYLMKINQEEFNKFGAIPESVFALFAIQKYLVVTGEHITRLYVHRSGAYLPVCLEIENPVREEILCPNIIGAGDIIMGILGCLDYKNINEYDIAEVLKIAMGVATVKCTKPFLGGDLIELFNIFFHKYVNQSQGHPILINNDKVFKKVVALEKRLNRSIIFINGSFDVLHAGHMSLFNEAQRLKEVRNHDRASIVIAINTDEDIKERKGKRPINITEKRLLQVSPFADYIMSFYGEKTLETIIKVLKPDVMVKGSDYVDKKITGSKYCGSIVYVPHTGDSSTKTRRKLK